MSLQEYRRKRRFDTTREPEPGKAAPRGGRAIFVVQLHHARRRHYDFRLQVGDALKSWAVPKGPSFDPSVKRLAVEVEDHPIEYAEFTGEIPQGAYGGGHVALFDRGVWASEGDPERGLAKGHLEFELFGDKLHGRWHLVRSGRQGGKPQWLLFKATDDFASDVEADDLLADVAPPRSEGNGKAPRSPAKKAAKKSKPATPRRSARSSSTLAKAAAALHGARRASLSSDAFEPELARLVERAPDGADWLHETKWDGYRLLTTVVDGQVRLWSRNALDWTQRVPEIVRAIGSLRLRSAAFDGELVVLRDGVSDFGLLQATLSGEATWPLQYVLFDLLHLEGHDLTRVALAERKALLERVLAKAPPHLVYSTHVEGNGPTVFDWARRHGLEGIISKRAHAPYRAGRGDDWRKVKQSEGDEFAVVGMTAPKGSRSGFGSVLLARHDARRGWVYAGRVGAGFSDEQLRTLGKRFARRKPMDAEAAGVTVEVDDYALRRARWWPPQEVVEVHYRGIGNQGLLRQPAFKTLREDKTADDLARTPGDRAPAKRGRAAARTASTPEKKTSTKATSAKKSSSVRTTSRRADDDELVIEGVRISHPDRVVYPTAGVTKGDVARYYASVMEWILPEIAGKPVSLVRCPEGIDKPCFFQKHRTHGLSRVDAIRIREDSGKTRDYLAVRAPDQLIELVQFGAIELHPWGCPPDDPDRADRIVFDLDPGEDVAWSRLIDAARQVRDLLAHVGLQSWPRATGGKGLHVVVPLSPPQPWDRVRAFARAFAESLAAAHPLEYIAVSTKARRKGRIFVDYLRNGRGATAVASFSLRSREGAPVAMPLSWSELGKLASGAAYDIASTPRRLARLKSHPWKGFDEAKQTVEGIAAPDASG